MPCPAAVYPRWRGEHITSFYIWLVLFGLSPLARGTLKAKQPGKSGLRFIPAGAGNTVPRCLFCQGAAVYPRWRGEHVNGFIFTLNAMRFIPAGAGNTFQYIKLTHHKTVYPRWRGEHFNNLCLSLFAGGLSPLARGTHTPETTTTSTSRFIPAGAGNTNTGSISPMEFSVYPRWRGEHIARSIRDLFGDGLSPLARGTRATGSSDRIRARFIPAGAGNTTFYVIQKSGHAVYPRWRGEHL